MNIDHVHFYVEDAQNWQAWFVQKLGFQSSLRQVTPQTITYAVQQQDIRFYLSSPCSSDSPVAAYLHRHPSGVADIAFQVADLEAIVQRAKQLNVALLQPIQMQQVGERWQKIAQVQGWGDLRHTLIEPLAQVEQSQVTAARLLPTSQAALLKIDHVVLNVEQGELQQALTWYEALFGFQRRQHFSIQTDYSGLCSQVLNHPQGAVQFPINEPTSSHSQIQEFLDFNGGSGIQHIALRTQGILPLVAKLRQQGLQFLAVPPTYYQQLQQRSGFHLNASEYRSIAQHQILVDWQPDLPQALLLQTFTQPIFEQPTFFFELIERRYYEVNRQLKMAEGFGEGNFQALFEAVEREQIKRGRLMKDLN